MSKFGRDEKEELLDWRASRFSGLRIVVCDTETTGLSTTTSRVVSLALSEVEQGRVLSGYATLVDPGLSHIGAAHIHHITQDVLRRAGAPSFDLVGPRLMEHLSPHGANTVVLAGYKVVFDALLLYNELARVGLTMPPVMLLDVQTLAQKAHVSAASLADLAASLGIESPDAHSSIGDTYTTTEALLRVTDRLHQADPDFRIEPFLVSFDPNMRISRRGVRGGREEEPLTPEHAAAHEKDLTHKRARENALLTCVDENCPHLVARTQDGIIDPVRARQVTEWVKTQLDRTDLTRVTRGRLLTGLAYSIGQTDKPDYIKATYDWTAQRLPAWGPCTALDQCDNCANDKAHRSCRYTAARYGLINAYLYQDNILSITRAEAFLPPKAYATTRGRGRPPQGWFGDLIRQGDLDAAGYGAQLVAQTGPQARTPGHERTILEFAWGKGSRNPHLADRYSLRLLADGSPDPARPHLTLAEQVCRDGLTGRGMSRAAVYDRLTDRLDVIQRRQQSTPKAPPTFTRNARAPRASLWGSIRRTAPP